MSLERSHTAAAGKKAKQPKWDQLSLPEGVSASSCLCDDLWTTQVSYGDVFTIKGIIMQNVFDNGVLSLGVNDRQVNTVYRFDRYGEQDINHLSRTLTQHSDIGLFLCPTHPGRMYLHHVLLGKTLPVLGEVRSTHRGFEIAFASVFEKTGINCKTRDITQEAGVSEHYRAIIDHENMLSTLIRDEQEDTRVLSVTDLRTGRSIYTYRIFAEESAACAVERHIREIAGAPPNPPQKDLNFNNS